MKTYTITVNGTAYNVTVEEGTTAAAKPQVKPAAAVAAAAAAAPAPVKAAAQGSVKIDAPMSGKILAIKAKAGQAVKKGDVIVVLEAMKMENDIVAPQDGTVASIDVTVGQAVESGSSIATLQ